MQTNYPGIDYGLGRTNIGQAGIRYGVIPANDVGQAWFDSAEADYGDPTCPVCGNKAETLKTKARKLGNGGVSISVCDKRQNWPRYRDSRHAFFEYACESCHHLLTGDDVTPDSPNGFSFEGEGYKATQGGDDCDIFILSAPYFTYAQFCSPCAPGACYLRSPLETPDANNRAYCFGHDWFEDGVAPYPVYSVKTGEIVQPVVS